MTADNKLLARCVFAPRSVALIGASGDLTKNSSRAQRLLGYYGYTGRVLPINPNQREVQGVAAYPNLAAVPEPIDHALIMVAQRYVQEAVEQCCAAKVPVATILSDGYAEAGGEGVGRQRALVDMARAAGTRLIGPNTLGLIDVHSGAALSMNALMGHERFIPGDLAVISHSGGMLGSILGRGHARGIGFSKLIGLGNECDLTAGELLDVLVDDEHTGAILLFLETVRDPARMAAAARRAYAAGKPVIAYMLGRSDYGKRLAASHTGALAGSLECIDAYLRHHGMLRVAVLETLLELPALLKGHRHRPRMRVAALTGTGGTAATVVDRLGELGVEVVPPSPSVIDALAAKGVKISNALLTDTTMGAGAKNYRTILTELLASDHCELVLAIAGSGTQHDPSGVETRITSVQPRNKPLAVFIGPPADAAHRLLARAGVAGFRTPETCADAIRAFRDWRVPAGPVAVDRARIEPAAALLARHDGARLNENDAYQVFAALGIDCAPSQVLGESGEGCTLGYPLAAKILSADIVHKSDIGGVRLGINDAAALRVAAADLMASVKRTRADARIDGVLVQSIERGIAEAILGYKHDPVVGPIVMLGAGGVLAEIYRDYAVRIAPVAVEEARDMISEVRGFAVLRGYRGAPPGDVEALARAVHAMSLLAVLAGDPVAEAEINPLIVKSEGVVAVDALVSLRR